MKLVENTKSHQVVCQEKSRNNLKVDSKVAVLPHLQPCVKESLNPDQLKQLSCSGSSGTGLFISKDRLSRSSDRLHSFSVVPSNTYPPSVQVNALSSSLQIESTYVMLDTS